jgi:hypothetical protein
MATAEDAWARSLARDAPTSETPVGCPSACTTPLPVMRSPTRTACRKCNNDVSITSHHHDIDILRVTTHSMHTSQSRLAVEIQEEFTIHCAKTSPQSPMKLASAETFHGSSLAVRRQCCGRWPRRHRRRCCPPCPAANASAIPLTPGCSLHLLRP